MPAVEATPYADWDRWMSTNAKNSPAGEHIMCERSELPRARLQTEEPHHRHGDECDRNRAHIQRGHPPPPHRHCDQPSAASEERLVQRPVQHGVEAVLGDPLRKRRRKSWRGGRACAVHMDHSELPVSAISSLQLLDEWRL